MMKKNFKAGIAVAVSVAFLVPGIMFAGPLQGLKDKASERATSTPAAIKKVKDGVCARMTELFSKIDQRLTVREAKIKEKRDERTENMGERREARNQKLEQFRLKWDGNREEFYKKLEEKADTGAKKQAMVNFKLKVEAAVKARRAAIDQAVDDFRAGVDKLVTSRKSAIDAAKLTYRNAVKTAYQNASTECAKDDYDGAKVRTELHAQLKAARDKYQQDIQAAEKVGKSIQELITARNQAVKKAIDDFKATMEKLRVELKAAWGATDNAETNSAGQ